jgi:precorrin-6B methylase 2
MQLAGLRNIFIRGRRAKPAFDARPAEAMRDGEAAPAPPADCAWTGQRLAMAEELWGEGFVGPCGAEEVLRLAAPMGLSAKSSLLLLGAGAGGPALAIAGKLGAWVSGLEADPVLVELAGRQIHHAGAAVAKHATVAGWSPAAPEFRRHAYHDALDIEAIRGTESLQPVLSGLTRAVRRGGQLVLLETVAAAPLDPGDAAVAAWCRLDRRSPALPSEADVTAMLARLGVDVRVVEDESIRHMRTVVLGWERLTRALRGPRPSPSYAACLVAEAELWTRRLRLLRDGRIRLVRWHGIADA